MMYCGVRLVVITAKLLILETLAWTAVKLQPVELVIQTKLSVLPISLAYGILTLPAHFLPLVWCNKIIDIKKKKKGKFSSLFLSSRNYIVIVPWVNMILVCSSLLKYSDKYIDNSIWVIIHTSHKVLLKTHSLIYKSRKKCLTSLKNLKSEFLV